MPWLFMDGREMPEDPNPTWRGYSIGRWEGDTLVVETGGFNDRGWLDMVGHPRSEKLHVTERFRRVDFGHIQFQISIAAMMRKTKHRTEPDRHGFAACTRLAGLLGLLWIFRPAGVAQKALSAEMVDPFIKTIETMKHSVVSLDCLAVNGAETKILERVGGAFLISAGDFLTAAHVVKAMQKSERPCPTAAITLPVGGWRPEASTEGMRWFPFKISDCRIDSTLDIAMCPVSPDLLARKRELHLEVTPVDFDWNNPPDGTQVAFTGFPLRARDPMTFRAHVAAFRTPWPDEPIPELVLDRPTLSGFSGSPVYLSNGKVVAIILKDGKDEAAGVTIVRPVSVFREMLRKKLQKE
jgi:V8-like Glu-specific endopeptidase